MLKRLAFGADCGELLLGHGKLGPRIVPCLQAAFAENSGIDKVEADGAADRGNHDQAENFGWRGDAFA